MVADMVQDRYGLFVGFYLLILGRLQLSADHSVRQFLSGDIPDPDGFHRLSGPENCNAV